MSDMNYVDGRFVFEDLHDLARQHRGEKIVVSWIIRRDAELFRFTPRVRKCIRYYRKDLKRHFARHRIVLEALEEMRTRFTSVRTCGTIVRAYAKDDRGKEHAQFVWV